VWSTGVWCGCRGQAAVSTRASSWVTSQAVVDAASFRSGPVAPGEAITIFGDDLGPAELAQARYEDGKLPTVVGETRVLFDGVPEPLIYSMRGQVSAVVPYGVPASTRVEVEYSEVKSGTVLIELEHAAPALFCYSSGSGQAVVVNQDGSFNRLDNRSDRGSVISVFLMGDGVVSPQISDGQLPHGPDFPVSAHSTRVLVGIAECSVVFRGLVYAGVTQLNVRIPPDAPVGSQVALEAIVGGKGLQPGVVLAVQCGVPSSNTHARNADPVLHVIKRPTSTNPGGSDGRLR
jgi:uncharacterized protein (TIGR03437 family)